MFSNTSSSQQLATATGIQNYSGSPSEDVEQWIRSFRLFSRARNHSEDDQKLHLHCLLTGSAKIYYNICAGEQLNVESMLDLLKLLFSEDPRTTWCEFIEKYVDLARRCHTPESVQVRWILRKLPENAVILLSTLKLAGYDILVDAILDCLRSTSMKNILKEWICEPTVQTVEAISKRRKANKWCNMHKRCAHMTEECKELNKSFFPYFLPNISAVKNLAKQFVRWVKFPSMEIQALIDTGASISCMKASIATSLNLTAREDENIITADGRRTTGKWTDNIQFTVMTRSWTTKFLTLPNLSYDIILGIDEINDLIDSFGAAKVFTNYEHTTSVYSILTDFESVMSDEISGISATNLPEFQINTGDHKPIAISRYRLDKPIEELIETEVQKLLENQIIRESSSPWCSPVVIAPKKDGSKRLCIDFRKINEVTIKDAYPLPRIDDILNTLAGSNIFSTLDATSGYHQIPIAARDIQKTAFQTTSGLYEFVRMPFGLSNAPAAFQRTMDNIFRDEKGEFLQVYLDDIIVYSKSREEHEKHLSIVLKKIQEANLKLKRKKCKFFQEELEILG